MKVDNSDIDKIYEMIPTWSETFDKADKETKRVLINKIVDKILITKEKITIKFKIRIDCKKKEPRMSSNEMVSLLPLIRGYKNIIFDDIVIEI